MFFRPRDLYELRRSLNALPQQQLRLLEMYLGRTYRHEKAREFAHHGFMRRVTTLARCVTNVFRLLPPELDKIPDPDAVHDAAINIQSFIFNVFGSVDNLAWIWVVENQIDLPPQWIGLGPKNGAVRSSLSAEFRADLDGLSDWFKHLESFRHSLAHRIPLYVPPYSVTESNIEGHQEFGRKASAALSSGDHSAYRRFSDAQRDLGIFIPQMTHSFSENPRPIVFHAQLLADFNTVVSIGEKMFKELGAQC
jgi:hypothetical protein